MSIPLIILSGCGDSNDLNRQIQGNSATVTINTTAADWSSPTDMSLIWSDEFNDNKINTSSWNYDTEASGWRKSWNNELQDYVDDGSGGLNAYVSNGNLVIRAIKQAPDKYTSARLTTRNKHFWSYGVLVAARIKLPYGQGIWPAFWMLPESGTWPDAGEIDIMELIGGGEGRDNKTYGTLHGPSFYGASCIQGSTILATGNFYDAYHVFAVLWTKGQINWFVDGILYHTVKSNTVPGRWPFDNGYFHILLNLAVGGSWPGYPDATTVFPQEMLIDWVRVYK
ncbi:MAG: glycoside hydrolase family 16 protein [Deltaproteobacteria bacterium]|nr:glycoside hydrolase family 16 protein [Deltaproteobacteria bacterium]